MEENLTIYKGFVSILGESGSGKSTLISILSGFEKLSKEKKQHIVLHENDENSIRYCDKHFDDCKSRLFGYIFQRCYEAKSLSAQQNIALPLFIQQQEKNSIVAHSKKLLNILNLSEHENSPANELSGGQLTRIGILRGIAQQPKILFADEPANNLDSENAAKMMATLKNWQKQTNGTVIMVTHHLEHAFSYSDQIIVFKSGEKDCGQIVYQKRKPENNWQESDKNEIKQYLKPAKVNEHEFPEALTSKKKHFLDYLSFLTNAAHKNIITKADGSRAISLITFFAFLTLFSMVFMGNQILSWFMAVDTLKNNTAYLKQCKISVQYPPGLSEDVRQVIESIRIDTVRQWLENKIYIDLKKVSEITEKQGLEPFEVFRCNEDKTLCMNLKEFLANKFTRSGMVFVNTLKSYNRYIITNQENSARKADDLKLTVQILKSVIRRSEFLNDICSLNKSRHIAKVYPRWSTGHEFVKKNGERMNITTTMRWLKFDDPFYENPVLKYLTNPDFRFQSDTDKGIIIDKETFVDELGYSLNDKEVKILYGTGEKACIPISAVVERMPEPDKYRMVTTFGFGSSIRSGDYHCPENRKYYRIKLTVNNETKFIEKMKIFNRIKNKDRNKNEMYEFSPKKNQIYQIDCNKKKYAKNREEWKQWLQTNFFTNDSDYNIEIDPKHEVTGPKEPPPPYTSGVVYVCAKEAVSALGEYLSVFYRAKRDSKWHITVYDFEEKIRFARQSEDMIASIKHNGFSLFALLFFLFLSTNMMINIRNKAPEIAIFRAMGASILSIIYIFNMQILMIVSFSILIAFTIVVVVIPYAQAIFIESVIYNLWNNIAEQREAIISISHSSIFDLVCSIIKTNANIVMMTIFCVIFFVSAMLLWVRYNPNYSISNILKER
jgi:ABC-type lipoprotein export system ATPase subunit